jgi:hypothetical protein
MEKTTYTEGTEKVEQQKRVDAELRKAQFDAALVVVEQSNVSASGNDVTEVIGYLGGTIERGRDVCYELSYDGLIEIQSNFRWKITEKGRAYLAERNVQDQPFEEMAKMREVYEEQMTKLGRQVIDSIREPSNWE